MATSSLAQSAQESTRQAHPGHKLFAERTNEFRHERGAWLVPSERRCGDFYAV